MAQSRFRDATSCASRSPRVPIRHHPTRALDDGILRTLWLDRDEIAAESARLRSPMVLASIDDWLAGRRIPLDAIHWLPSDTASA